MAHVILSIFFLNLACVLQLRGVAEVSQRVDIPVGKTLDICTVTMAEGADAFFCIKSGNYPPAAVTRLTLDKVRDKINLPLWGSGSFLLVARNNCKRDAELHIVGVLSEVSHFCANFFNSRNI